MLFKQPIHESSLIRLVLERIVDPLVHQLAGRVSVGNEHAGNRARVVDRENRCRGHERQQALECPLVQNQIVRTVEEDEVGEAPIQIGRLECLLGTSSVSEPRVMAEAPLSDLFAGRIDVE